MTTNQDQTVKGQGHKVIYCISSKNAITRQWIVISNSNLVEIFIVMGETCDILFRPVGQVDRK